MKNIIGWFDIPVNDLDRSINFYSKVLDVEIKKEFEGMDVGIIQHSKDVIGGCLFKSKDESPSSSGILIYMNVDGRLDEAITVTKDLGGKILKEKHQIGPFGFRAIILDSEGNRIALHSN